MHERGYKLRVGIAGYGVVGKRRHACINKHPDMEVVAVCDRSFPGDGKLGAAINFHSNYQDILKESLDVLFVCMTNDIAPEVTIAGLENGLHVFCEKPPGRNVDDIARVIRCEKTHPGLKLMYGFNHRYHESVVEALRIVRSGEMGKVISMRGVYGKSKLITFNQPDWRVNRDIAGGGVLLDQGIHMVDLMRLFAGEFSEVHSFISNGHWGYDVEDNAYALMRTAGGVVAMLNSSATQWRHRFNLDITLDRGSVILGGILSGSKSYGAETLTVVHADPDEDNGDPLEQLTRYNRDPSWDEEVNRFASCILDGTVVGSGSSEDALNTMRLVYKIYHADPQWREKYAIPDPDGYIHE
jgi:predicted dehydrogenase